MAASASQQAVKILRAKGGRITAVRKKMLDIFHDSHVPLSAVDILEKIRVSGIKSDKTTVYRQVDEMLKHGIIEEVRLADRVRRFETAFGAHHHHLVCLCCGKIVDVGISNDLKKFEQRLSRQKKFKISKHSLEFYGECLSCQKKNQ